MKYINYYLILVFFVGVVVIQKTHAQEENKVGSKIKLGLNFGNAAKAKNTDYFHENTYFKVQINYLLKESERFNFELHIEPSLYFTKHQLLNKHFIKPEDAPNYLELREKFTKKRSFNEYTLNIGGIVRYKFIEKLSTYAIVSTGPMIGGKETERLSKGFAFSNVFGIGFSYHQKLLSYDLRGTYRHTSNLQLSSPNNGHNSWGFEFGVSFQL